MKLPAESASSISHVAFASFTLHSLRAWSEIDVLTEAQRAALTGMAEALDVVMRELLRELRETEDQIIFGRPGAQARRNAMLVLLGRVVNEILSIVVQRAGAGSKDHPAVREFLPSLATGITRAAIDERAELAETAAGRLESLSVDFDGRAGFVTRLRTVAASVAAAIAAAEAAFRAWKRERSEEVVAKGRLRLELERVHGLLQAEFPGQRSFVESFFLKGSRPSEGAEEEETGTEPTE